VNELVALRSFTGPRELEIWKRPTSESLQLTKLDLSQFPGGQNCSVFDVVPSRFEPCVWLYRTCTESSIVEVCQEHHGSFEATILARSCRGRTGSSR